MATPLPDKDEKSDLVLQIKPVDTNDSAAASPHSPKGRDVEEGNNDDKMTFRRFMPLVAMAFLWTGSQIPLYLFGAIPPYIYQDIGGADRWIWFVLGNLLALASVCPFVGSLSDLFGRRWVAIIGATLLIVGVTVASTAHIMNIFIAGMAIAGVGAGINELTALAVTSEIAPVNKRGIYVSALVFTILPFCPSILWAQLIASHAGWRYVGVVCGVWSFIGLTLTVIFYHPPPRVNSAGLSRMETLKRIDYFGGFTSISGMLLFMCALQWGGYNYPWKSAHVLVPLFLGVFLLAVFFVWESKFAKYPMFPHRVWQEPRMLILTLIITAISGASFFSIILFWPTQSYNVYGHDPLGVGIRNITLGFSILTGACVVLVLLSLTKGHIRSLLVGSCIFMTAGTGAMAAMRPDNIWLCYVVVTIGGLGIGGIVVPASIISTIICPDDLIATIASLTLAIRVLGGAIGYAVYWNIFYNKFVHAATEIYLVPETLKVLDPQVLETLTKPQIEELVTKVVEITGAGLLPALREIPGVTTDAAYNAIVLAGQLSYAYAYKYVYYVSIAFGVLSIICSAFLGDIKKYMNGHVAAAYH